MNLIWEILPEAFMGWCLFLGFFVTLYVSVNVAITQFRNWRELRSYHTHQQLRERKEMHAPVGKN